MGKAFDVSELIKLVIVAERVKKYLDEKLPHVSGKTALAADVATMIDLILKFKADNEELF